MPSKHKQSKAKKKNLFHSRTKRRNKNNFKKHTPVINSDKIHLEVNAPTQDRVLTSEQKAEYYITDLNEDIKIYQSYQKQKNMLPRILLTQIERNLSKLEKITSKMNEGDIKTFRKPYDNIKSNLKTLNFFKELKSYKEQMGKQGLTQNLITNHFPEDRTNFYHC